MNSHGRKTLRCIVDIPFLEESFPRGRKLKTPGTLSCLESLLRSAKLELSRERERERERESDSFETKHKHCRKSRFQSGLQFQEKERKKKRKSSNAIIPRASSTVR